MDSQMKVVWLLTIFLLLSLAPLVSAETITVTAPRANIRSGPGMGYKIIDRAKKGDALKSIERRKGWIKVRLHGGREGWITERLVASTPAPLLRVKVEKENLRRTPGGQKIGEVLKDAELKVIGTEGRWVEVEMVGWIWRDSTTAEGTKIPESTEESWKGVEKIKGGFSYQNVKLTKSMDMVKVMGEMKNGSGKNFRAASFLITFYDQKGQLLETGDILINHFSDGQTKPFTAYMEHLIYESVHRYKIEFDFGIEKKGNGLERG
jgi:SH3-like domain-containing protein